MKKVTKPTAKKPTAKKAPAKKTTKKAAPKKKKTTKKETKKSVKKDGAKEVASKVNLDIDQVRIVRALTNRKEAISMADLKDKVGIGRDNKYSGKWLTSLKSLESRRIVSIGTQENVRGHTYIITAIGRKMAAKVK